MENSEIKEYKYSGDYNEHLLAELYDNSENYEDDVKLIQSLIGRETPKRILECFSGTGRIQLPLLIDGHKVTGIELAEAMSARAGEKIRDLSPEMKENADLKVADVLTCNWGEGFDVVVIGCNALYELPNSDLQKQIIEKAFNALMPDGYIYIDNNDYKGNWGSEEIGKKRVVFEGIGKRGDYGKYIMEGVAFDEEKAVLHMKRTWIYRDVNGQETVKQYLGKKHPVTGAEVEQWLAETGFKIIKKLGDTSSSSYREDSSRAIFWAQK